jgi:hypothetical protein
MTTLATDPLTLTHLTISILGILTGVPVLVALVKGKTPVTLTGVFLALSVLTSVTGFLFHNKTITPGMIIGAISLLVLAVALFAYYGRHLMGRWRPVYVIAAILALYLNVFVLIIQSFIKIPSLHAVAPSIPPSGLVFGSVQSVAFITFLLAGRLAIKAGRPTV